jgi:mRNA-degrading endonuclease RelE of RelBE toxin-antitoxin system
MADTPMTVVETARFLKDAKSLLSDSEREELVVFVGASPEAGEIIAETGGVRKIRWALAGRGKRGGARVIYYYQRTTTAIPAGGLWKEREGESQQGRAKRDEAVGSDPGGGVSGEEVGGHSEHEGDNQACGEKGGPCGEKATHRRRAHHRGAGGGDCVDARRER